jgi:hypothetical protein
MNSGGSAASSGAGGAGASGGAGGASGASGNGGASGAMAASGGVSGSAGSGGVGTSVGTGGSIADAGDAGSNSDVDGGGVDGGGVDGGGDPAFPAPSVDCSTRTDTVHCVSAVGELNGVPFDITCTMPGYDFQAVSSANQAWEIACEDFTVERRVDVWIPLADPGPFSFGTADAENTAQISVEISSQTRTALSGRGNLESMRIEGEMRMDPAIGTAPIVMGTFQARFRELDDTFCDLSSCPEAWASASFRSVFDL